MASSVGGEGDACNSSGSSADWQEISLRASTLGMSLRKHIGTGTVFFSPGPDSPSDWLLRAPETPSGPTGALHCSRSWAWLRGVVYDWCSWIPNAPPTMRCPPPTEKGKTTIEYIIKSLPDRGRSCWHLGAVWALSQFQENE
ncbi:hypothetical protein E2320_010821, partial [Naja naja]